MATDNQFKGKIETVLKTVDKIHLLLSGIEEQCQDPEIEAAISEAKQLLSFKVLPNVNSLADVAFNSSVSSGNDKDGFKRDLEVIDQLLQQQNTALSSIVGGYEKQSFSCTPHEHAKNTTNAASRRMLQDFLEYLLDNHYLDSARKAAHRSTSGFIDLIIDDYINKDAGRLKRRLEDKEKPLEPLSQDQPTAQDDNHKEDLSHIEVDDVLQIPTLPISMMSDDDPELDLSDYPHISNK